MPQDSFPLFYPFPSGAVPFPNPICRTSPNPDDTFDVFSFWTEPPGDCVTYHVTWSGDILWDTTMEEPHGEADVRGDSYVISSDAPPYTKYSVTLEYDTNKTATCDVTTEQRGRIPYYTFSSTYQLAGEISCIKIVILKKYIPQYKTVQYYCIVPNINRIFVKKQNGRRSIL